MSPSSRRPVGAGTPEAPAITLGEAIDGTLTRIETTGGVDDRAREHYRLNAKFWEPLRSTRVLMLRRARVEDMMVERAKAHPRSAKNELEFLKRALRPT